MTDAIDLILDNIERMITNSGLEMDYGDYFDVECDYSEHSDFGPSPYE